jgi:hypothetical protein
MSKPQTLRHKSNPRKLPTDHSHGGDIMQNINKELEMAESYLMRAGEILNKLMTENKPAPTTQTTTGTATPMAIIWHPATGPNGNYEKAEVQNNPDFTELQAKIDANTGKLFDNGFFYWTFREGQIGRKPVKK